MGEKDIAEKILLAYNDVFSDIVNVLLFGGQEVIQGNDLEDQTSSDSDMPLRVIAYDGMEYRAQLLKKTVDEPDEAKKQERYPVITMVLYFGYEHLWNGPISLKDRLKIPDGLDDYVNDYKFNLYQIAYLPDEQIQQFKRDFRVVAEFFSQKRKQLDYTPSNQQLQHAKEVLQLFSIMTDDARFEDIYNEELEKGEGGVKTMCDVLDRAMEKGKLAGIEEGRKTGKLDGFMFALKLVSAGRESDLGRATRDDVFRSKLIEEFGE